MQTITNYHSQENLQPHLTLVSRTKNNVSTIVNSKRVSNVGSPFQKSLKTRIETHKNSREMLDTNVNTNSSSRKLLRFDSNTKNMQTKALVKNQKEIKLNLDQQRKSISQDKLGDKKLTLHERLNAKFNRKSLLHNNIMTEKFADHTNKRESQMWKRQSQQTNFAEKRQIKFLEMSNPSNQAVRASKGNPYNNQVGG